MLPIISEELMKKFSLEELVDMEEGLQQVVNKLNFDIEGLNEEKNGYEESKAPRVHERKLHVIDRRLYRLNTTAAGKLMELEKIKRERDSRPVPPPPNKDDNKK